MQGKSNIKAHARAIDKTITHNDDDCKAQNGSANVVVENAPREFLEKSRVNGALKTSRESGMGNS